MSARCAAGSLALRNLRVLACVFLFAGLAVGCTPAAEPAGPTSAATIPAPGVGGQPTPTALSSTAVAQTPTPPPTPTPAQSATVFPFGETPVQAGRYFTENQGYRYTFTTPAFGWWLNAYPDARVVGKDHGDNGTLTRFFILGDVRTVSTDACHWQGTDSTPGPTVDDLVAALAAVEGFGSSEPSATTVDGYRGKHVRLTVPDDVNMDDCDNGEFHGIAEGFYDFSPGQVQDVWVLDLDGSRRLLFSAFGPNTPAAAQEELDLLIHSLEIEPVP